MLQLELERAALSIAGDEPDRDKWKHEGGGQLARAERRRPDADERRKGFTDARGRAVEAAEIRIRVDRADERDANERSHREEEHPPRARADQLAPLFGQEPQPGTPR